MNGRVVQINRKPETPGQHGLPKLPVGSIRITRHGLEGDYNRFRHHAKADDPGRAVMLFPLETIRELNAEGWPVKPGDMGENITTEGIPYNDFAPGVRYKLGEVIVQISEPCIACRILESLPYVSEEKGVEFIRTLTHMDGGTLVNRRGWYAAVLQEGTVSQGDAIEPLASSA